MPFYTFSTCGQISPITYLQLLSFLICLHFSTILFLPHKTLILWYINTLLRRVLSIGIFSEAVLLTLFSTRNCSAVVVDIPMMQDERVAKCGWNNCIWLRTHSATQCDHPNNCQLTLLHRVSVVGWYWWLLVQPMVGHYQLVLCWVGLWQLCLLVYSRKVKCVIPP